MMNKIKQCSDRLSTYNQRMNDLKETFLMLSEAILKTKREFRIEYAYLGLDDNYTYDLRKNVERSSKHEESDSLEG